MPRRDSPRDDPDPAGDAHGRVPDAETQHSRAVPCDPASVESPAHSDAGPWFGGLEQLDFDIDFLERLLDRNQGAIEVLRVLAELVSRKGLLERAVELDRRLVAALPEDFLVRYNLACSLARLGRPDEAIDSLTRAILLGYDDLAHLETDPDLDSLRNHPDFQELFGPGRTA